MRTDDLLKSAVRDWDGHHLDTTFSHFSHSGMCIHLSLIPAETKTGYKCDWFLNSKRISKQKLEAVLELES
tara:strand:+ start:4382 stop:4594 length:213 start_codon:yes stop_codon:yes gene_type:complete